MPELTDVDRKATPLVLTGHRPVAVDPELAIVVREAKGGGLRDRNKLTLKTLPEVQAVLLGLKCGVDFLNATTVIGDAKEPIGAGIERGEELSRGAPVFPKDHRCDRVARGKNTNAGGGGDLRQVEVVRVGIRTVLCDLAVESDSVTNCD
jgi:hypothetical protein